jgi:hypothetical protein
MPTRTLDHLPLLGHLRLLVRFVVPLGLREGWPLRVPVPQAARTHFRSEAMGTARVEPVQRRQVGGGPPVVPRPPCRFLRTLSFLKFVTTIN